jgi:hypothetical protein
MDDLLGSNMTNVEAMFMIEALDNERARWLEIIQLNKGDLEGFDYENDLVILEEFISKVKEEIIKKFDEDVIKFAHFPRGKRL